MNSKNRGYLKGLASSMDCILSLGKSTVTPEFTEAVREALDARGLIKINVLKNCSQDLSEIANTLADRTHGEVIQIIGRKIVLYKPDPEKPRIQLPVK